MTSNSWCSAETLQSLREDPSLIEPGLTLHPEPVESGNGGTPVYHGSDPMHRPCLVLFEDRFEPAFFDHLIETAGQFASDARGRIFVLTPAVEAPQLSRFEVLARAMPLRVFTLGLQREAGRARPVLAQEFPVRRAPLETCLDTLQPGVRSAAGRVLRAAQVIRPSIEVRGPAWPLVFAGRRGPFAVLHCSAAGDRVVLARRAGLLPLDDEAAVDSAIDCLLREQWAESTAA